MIKGQQVNAAKSTRCFYSKRNDFFTTNSLVSIGSMLGIIGVCRFQSASLMANHPDDFLPTIRGFLLPEKTTCKLSESNTGASYCKTTQLPHQPHITSAQLIFGPEMRHFPNSSCLS